MIARTLSRRLVALRRRQPVVPAPAPAPAPPLPERTLGDVVQITRFYIDGPDCADPVVFDRRVTKLRKLLKANGYERVSNIPPGDTARMYRLIQDLPR